MIVRQNWESLKDLDVVASNIMVEGLKVEFLKDPTLTRKRPPGVVTGHIQSARLEEFITPWLKEGIIGRGKDAEEGFFSRMFTVPKDGGKWRPIIDLSDLNKRLKKRSFKMEDLKSVVKLIRPGMWAVKLDLKDAYFHVPLHPLIWNLFKFVLRKKGKLRSFFFKRLPFGLTIAPWAFTRILAPLKKILRLKNIIISAFLDDFLILARSREEALEHTGIVINLLQDYGFRINWEKSSPEPVRILEYLGVVVDLENLTFSLPEEKVLKILSLCHKSQRVEKISRRELEKIVGFLNFAAGYIKWGKLYLKPIQR